MDNYLTKTPDRANGYICKLAFGKDRSGTAVTVFHHKLYLEVTELMLTPYLDPDGSTYKKIREDVKNNPEAYSVDSLNDVDLAMKNIIKGLGELFYTFKNNEYPPRIFDDGIYILSDKFYEDVSSGQINKYKYVSALIKLSDCFKMYV